MSRLSIFALFLAGCSASFSSSLTDSLTLAELDETQTCTLQEEQNDFFEKAFSDKDGCTFGAQIEAAFAIAFEQSTDYTATCEAAFDTCMDGGDDDEEYVFECYDWSVPEDCSYTIADFEACQNEYTDALRDVLAMGCDEPEDMEGDSTELSATCQAIQDECYVYFF